MRPDALAGCIFTGNFFHSDIEGTYDPVSGLIQGTVVSNAAILELSGSCPAYAELEAEGRRDGFFQENAQVGDTWEVQSDDYPITLSIWSSWGGSALAAELDEIR